MAKIVVGLFDRFEDARRAVEELAAQGFRREDISLVANDQNQQYKQYMDEGGSDVAGGTAAGAGIGAIIGGLGGLLVGLGALAIPGIGPVLAAGPLVSALAGAGIGAAAGGLLGALIDAGVPEEHAQNYVEGIRRGGTLVTVRASDDQAGRAVDVLNRFNPVDVERRSEEWRHSETTGVQTPQQTNLESRRYGEETASRDANTEGEVTLPVVEEELRVGKREVQTGEVRVETDVTETPVEETVNLRREHVEVERRPVDRPATDTDLDAFKEGTMEIEEHAEEAIVDKQTRVVEEVHIRKDVEHEQETIRDSVRRQDVHVDREAGATQTTGYDDYTEFEPMFRNHYNTAYTTSGYTYDDYAPAYRYGYDLARDRRYYGRDWQQIETDARRDWETRHPDNAWENFKDAVRNAWMDVTGRR